MDRSFGIIPLRRIGDGWETLLVKHQKGHWAFPKGHAEQNETPQESALREFKEETGLTVKRFLQEEPLREFYVFKREGNLTEKIVTYFLAEVEGNVSLQKEELAECCWLPFKEAAERITFPESKVLAHKAAQLVGSLL